MFAVWWFIRCFVTCVSIHKYKDRAIKFNKKNISKRNEVECGFYSLNIKFILSKKGYVVISGGLVRIDKKKAIRHGQPIFIVNLKSNTMKNTMQI